MSYVTIEDRVDRLEGLFGKFISEMAILAKRADDREKAAEERHRLAEERNRAAEERMARFEQEMREFKDEMGAFKDEMGGFKTEMGDFKAEMRQSKRDLDKKWGDLANKLGTIIEDILAPNLRRLAGAFFGFEVIEDFMMRRARRRPGPDPVEAEFDTVIVSPDAVILGEAKSTPSVGHADEFATKVQGFFEYFPEYRGRRLIPVLGSWAMADTVVDRLTAHRIYAMRMGADTMELANAAQLEGKTT